jgi:hypothetical protein
MGSAKRTVSSSQPIEDARLASNEFRIEDVRCLLDSEANDFVDVPLAGLRLNKCVPRVETAVAGREKRRNDGCASQVLTLFAKC